MKKLRGELVGYNALIFYPRRHIKVLEGEMNTPKKELESLRLEAECFKITTKESPQKLLRLGMDSLKLGDQINAYSLRLGDFTRDM